MSDSKGVSAFGIVVIGIFTTFTVINCQNVRLTNISPLVRYIIELRERGGTAPAVSPIIGGSTAQLNQYPWQLLVLYIADNMKGRILCSGTILNKRTVLTAGHCCDFDTEQRNGFFVVVAGLYDLNDVLPFPPAQVTPAQVVFIEDVRLHQGFKLSERFGALHDIALLITDTDIDFSTPAAQPVPGLSNRKLDCLAIRSDRCVSIGWGVYRQTEDGGFELPNMLQELSPTNLVHNQACWRAIKGTGFGILPTNICALDKNQSVCFGDSGGFNGCKDKRGVFYQVGLTSGGPSPNCSAGIQVFTRVSKYTRWIDYYKYK